MDKEKLTKIVEDALNKWIEKNRGSRKKDD